MTEQDDTKQACQEKIEATTQDLPYNARADVLNANLEFKGGGANAKD